MSESRTLDTLFGFIWAASFTLSIFLANTAWGEMTIAPEKTAMYWSSLALIFVVPLIFTAIIWILGRISDKVYLLTIGWFGVLYSIFYTVYTFLILVVVGILQPAFGDPRMVGLVIGWVIVPFLIPGILVWFLLKKYATNYKGDVKKDFVYIFGYLYIGLIFTIQFYAYTFWI